jgi:hypothetical protein
MTNQAGGHEARILLQDYAEPGRKRLRKAATSLRINAVLRACMETAG